MSARARAASALFLAAMGWSCVAQGASPLVGINSIASRTPISGQATAELPLNCPGSAVALSGSVTPSAPESAQILARRGLISGAPAPIVDGVHAAPTGMSYTVRNTSPEDVIADMEVLCGTFQAGFGNSSLAVVNHTLQAGERRTVNAVCRAGQIATGGLYEWLGGPVVWDAPWGLFAGYAGGYFGVPDGTHPAPAGWEVDAANLSGVIGTIRVGAICHQNPDARTVVGSAYLDPGQFAFRGLAIGDDIRILGQGVHGGQEGRVRGGARWTPRWGVNFSRDPLTLSATGGGFAGGFLRDLRAPGTMAPQQLVRVGLVVEPYNQPPPPVQIVNVVEYRHAARGFYFSTADPVEIVDLDALRHPGWSRTGESFNAYAIGSGGPVGRQPVMRSYAESLGSHFYTGSVKEQLDVQWRFNRNWHTESGEVFQWQLPNPANGDCPAGTDPLYRTFNPAGNHRLTKSFDIRNRTIEEEGHVSEGFGDSGVVACLPRLSF